MYRALAALSLAALLSACATFPDLDRAKAPAASQDAYLPLLPLNTLLAAAPALPEVAPDTALTARAAALRARAAALAAATP